MKWLREKWAGGSIETVPKSVAWFKGQIRMGDGSTQDALLRYGEPIDPVIAYPVLNESPLNGEPIERFEVLNAKPVMDMDEDVMRILRTRFPSDWGVKHPETLQEIRQAAGFAQ
jgi:hypothetical protein